MEGESLSGQKNGGNMAHVLASSFSLGWGLPKGEEFACPHSWASPRNGYKCPRILSGTE